MAKKYNLSLFIFRRDLRLSDNTALNAALNCSKAVIPCFIFDTQQVSNENEYKSNNALQFMLESLDDLDKQLAEKKGKLYYFHGCPTKIIKSLIKKLSLNAVFINKDYTPFSIARDEAIEQLCKENKVTFNAYDDALLNAPGMVLKNDGSSYSVFTPFYKKSITIPVAPANKLKNGEWFCKSIEKAENRSFFKKILSTYNDNIALHGGTNEALKIITHLNRLTLYKKEHDYPSITTSLLSAHLKFGTLSVRYLYKSIKDHLGAYHPLLRQLYWRDFFTHIVFYHPTVFGNAYHTKYNQLKWNTNKKQFDQWCQGRTGFPMVDAGMRELNTTGFMHNRVRMIVASFLVKDLHINWLWGEKYFAQKLVDYDPAVNNGNWQWCASTGCDAQPYFRIFNPWLQQKKYDADCIYIKKWIPELRNYDNKIIHNWFKEKSPIVKDYPRPMLDHGQESAVSKKLFSTLKNKKNNPYKIIIAITILFLSIYNISSAENNEFKFYDKRIEAIIHHNYRALCKMDEEHEKVLKKLKRNMDKNFTSCPTLQEKQTTRLVYKEMVTIYTNIYKGKMELLRQSTHQEIDQLFE